MEGDADAFARLYDAHIDPIYRFIFYRVGETGLAEDLTSQVFLKAWEKLHQYEVRGLPFGAWLFRIARNLIADHYRAKREVLSLEASEVEQVVIVENVAVTVETKVDIDLLLAQLSRLTENQRQVLTLKFLDGLDTDEIAKILGKREGAIRALQMRGLQTLASLLEATATP